MSEAVAALLRLNLVAAAAIGIVLVLRVPARRLFGPRIAYGWWSLVAFAVAAMLTPARTVVLAHPEPPAAPDALLVMHQGFAPTLQLAAAPDLSKGLALLWIGGGLAALLWLARSQARFDRAVREGRAGPAVVGVVRPRIVAPSDFAQRYSPREQRVVLAHEATHIAPPGLPRERAGGPAALRQLVQSRHPPDGALSAHRPGVRLRRPGDGAPSPRAPRLWRGHAEDPAGRPSPCRWVAIGPRRPPIRWSSGSACSRGPGQARWAAAVGVDRRRPDQPGRRRHRLGHPPGSAWCSQRRRSPAAAPALPPGREAPADRACAAAQPPVPTPKISPPPATVGRAADAPPPIDAAGGRPAAGRPRPSSPAGRLFRPAPPDPRRRGLVFGRAGLGGPRPGGHEGPGRRSAGHRPHRLRLPVTLSPGLRRPRAQPLSAVHQRHPAWRPLRSHRRPQPQSVVLHGQRGPSTWPPARPGPSSCPTA